jgi:serine/threonine-protein kinase
MAANSYSLSERSSFREQVKQIFIEVCDLDSLALRNRRMEELCGANRELLEEVRRLLANDFDGDIFEEDAPVTTTDEWIGRTVNSCTLLERIADGGMGVVYRGEDVRLKRQVAVKFLFRHMLGDERQRERFLREAQAAAALNHPSICPVYDIGTMEGQPFIIMAYLPGETLESAMRGRLSLSQALRHVIQIAEGLAVAHAAGIVHRDLKPSNVILARKSDGKTQATIIDFGLARVQGGKRLTELGRLIGTATYICPDLLEGKPVEAQSDVWSLGVMLYEMLAGRPPFDAENRERLFHLICHEDPERLDVVNPALPEEAGRIAAKALEKDARKRYQDISSFLADLRALKRRLSRAGRPTRRRASSAHEKARVVSTSHSITPLTAKASLRVARKSWMLAALVPVALAASSWLAWTQLHTPYPSTTGLKRVAILPFEALGPGPRSDDISRMIGDSVAVQMAGLSDIRTISGSSVRGLWDKGATYREIKAQLRPDYLVTGTTTPSGETLQVSVNLISGEDDTVLWSKYINLPKSDLRARQVQFVQTTVHEIESTLAPREDSGPIPASRGAAYDSLRIARVSLVQYRERAQPEFLQAAEAGARRALKLDPAYTDAMAELADIQLMQLYSPRADRTALLADAAKWLDLALTQDPNHPKARRLKSSIHRERGEYLPGLAQARRALENAPGDGEIHVQLALLYSALGFFESALVEDEKALETGVSQVTPLYGKMSRLVTLGKFKEVEMAMHELMAFDRKGAMFPAGEALLQFGKGNYRKAQEIYQDLQQDGGAFRVDFEIGAALARAATGEINVGKAVLNKYRSGIRKSDDILLLAATVGDVETMVRLTRESTSYNSYGWLVRHPAFMKNIAGKQTFRELVFDLHQRWEADLAAERPSLPAPPPALPGPEEFLTSLH